MLTCCLLVLISISDLTSETEIHRIGVAGEIVHVTPRTGRLGSHYLEIIIEEDGSQIKIFSDFIISGKVGDWFIAIGEFFPSGSYGGYPEEKFIVLKEAYSSRNIE